MTKLTDKIVKTLPAPEKGNRITYDSEVKGFGVRITAAGARSFILNYRTRTGRERRYTIGAYPDRQTTAARAEAKRLKGEIRVNGADPVGDLETERGTPTVADLVKRYVEEHLPKKRSRSQDDDRYMIGQWVLTNGLRAMHVSEVTHDDIDQLHRRITKAGTPTRANRVIALLSKMFSLAIRWRWRLDNPCHGIERNPERKRTRYLSGEEVKRLTDALAKLEDQQAANAIRLLLLTGARRGETLAARWSDIDLEAGVWTKPGATTKQKTEHRVPLSAPARQLLAGMDRQGDFLFPGKVEGHRGDLDRPWAAIQKAAKLGDVHLHDLRHTYASVLASSGQSLHVIGALLGHTNPGTTMRYAHLVDDPLRTATETAGAVITGGKKAEVKRIRR